MAKQIEACFSSNSDERETCADCPFSIENIEGDDETGYGIWYECKFIDGGAYPNEKLKDCPLKESEDTE